MKAADLEAAGLKLFGPRWKTRMATEVGVDAATLRRWMARDEVPRRNALAIQGLLCEHAKARDARGAEER